jgi:hypothetical protein
MAPSGLTSGFWVTVGVLAAFVLVGLLLKVF